MTDDRPEWADDDDTDQATVPVDPAAVDEVPEADLAADEAAAVWDPAVEGREPA